MPVSLEKSSGARPNLRVFTCPLTRGKISVAVGILCQLSRLKLGWWPHRTRPGNRWLRGTLTQTGWDGAGSKSSLFHARYQRLKLRRGGQRAVTAIAHAQLRTIYWALRNGTPYPEQVQRLEQDQREAQIRHHLQRLTKLGYEPNK